MIKLHRNSFFVVLLVCLTHPPLAMGLEIIGNFLAPGEVFPGTDGAVAIGPPPELVGGGNLTDIFNAAGDIWEAAILDGHTVIINYGWADDIPATGFETLVSQQSEPPYRQTESLIRIKSLAGIPASFYMDPTPLDPSEYTTFYVSHRDLGAGDVNSERAFRGATGLAENNVDLFNLLIHEIGHALGLDGENTAYANAVNDFVMDVGDPLPFAGSQITTFGGHLAPGSTLMGFLDGGERRYPSELDILAVAQLGQFTNINLRPAQFPEPNRGPFIDALVAPGPGKVLFGPDDQLYISTFSVSLPIAMRNEIRRYDSETRELVDVFASQTDTQEWPFNNDKAHTMAFGPDGNLYMVGKDGGNSGVLRFSGTTGDFIDMPVANHPDMPRALAFGPDGDLYVIERTTVDGPPGRVFQYDPETGEQKGIAARVAESDRMDILFGPDGDLFIRSSHVNGERSFLVHGDGEIFIENLNEGIFPLLRDAASSTGSLEFGPDGNLYAESGSHIRVFDGNTGDYLGKFIDGHEGGLTSSNGLTFGPDGNLYAPAAGWDEVIIFTGPLAVPEPSGIGLLTIGVVAISSARRRQKRSTRLP